MMSCARWAGGVLVVLLSVFKTAAAPSWSEDAGFRTLEVSPGTGGKPGFTLMKPEASGVWFTNRLQGDAYLTNAVAHNGAGVAIGDVDGDGWPDIYLCSLQGPNRLYRNLGQWRFQEMDIVDAACADQLSTGATLADVDGDGDLDLLVNGIGAGTRLFLNDGHGVFSEVTHSGLSRRYGAMTSALADVDGDGQLDLYVANYRTTTIRSTGFSVLNVGGRRMIRPEDRDRLEYTPEGRVLEHGEADLFYRSLGGSKFAE